MINMGGLDALFVCREGVAVACSSRTGVDLSALAFGRGFRTAARAIYFLAARFLTRHLHQLV